MFSIVFYRKFALFIVYRAGFGSTENKCHWPGQLSLEDI